MSKGKKINMADYDSAAGRVIVMINQNMVRIEFTFPDEETATRAALGFNQCIKDRAPIDICSPLQPKPGNA